jgi:hypothetical protein
VVALLNSRILLLVYNRFSSLKYVLSLFRIFFIVMCWLCSASLVGACVGSKGLSKQSKVLFQP